MGLACVTGNQLNPADPTQVTLTVQYDAKDVAQGSIVEGKAVRVSDGCDTGWYTGFAISSGVYECVIPLGNCYQADTEYILHGKASADTCRLEFRTNP